MKALPDEFHGESYAPQPDMGHRQTPSLVMIFHTVTFLSASTFILGSLYLMALAEVLSRSLCGGPLTGKEGKILKTLFLIMTQSSASPPCLPPGPHLRVHKTKVMSVLYKCMYVISMSVLVLKE